MKGKTLGGVCAEFGGCQWEKIEIKNILKGCGFLK